VAAIAAGTPDPSRVVGLHFFNPPHQMPLVEVVRGPQSNPQMVAKAAALAARIGKTLVLVGDCAGFLVNRILAPYMNEAGHLVAEVEDPLQIDRAAIEFGMPMGPLALIDLVGIGVSSHVSENLRAAYGERMEPAPIWQALRNSTDASKVGTLKVIEKTWTGKRLNPAVQAAINDLARRSSTQKAILSHEEIIQRLVYPLINEAARCLDERIVECPDDVDLAMVFGTGFAPFRGGPLRYADSVGVPKIVQTLERLAKASPRFEPCERLRRMAAANERFHPADL
jgi:3-hydroxyacyl-CoA dehydrogenase/enoyl-CoA hydratase/3-hydroxybutyryl-CoA epimerase